MSLRALVLQVAPCLHDFRDAPARVILIALTALRDGLLLVVRVLYHPLKQLPPQGCVGQVALLLLVIPQRHQRHIWRHQTSLLNLRLVVLSLREGEEPEIKDVLYLSSLLLTFNA